MSRFVALQRGINVGGARKVPMTALRAALERAGYSDVRTYLQSGNVVFSAEGGSAERHSADIEACIEREFGFPVDTLVLTCADLERVWATNPFLAAEPDTNESWLHAAFPLQPLTPDTFAACALPADDGEQALLGDGVIYLRLPHGVGRSKLAGGISRALGTSLTMRNWRTVTALSAMCRE